MGATALELANLPSLLPRGEKKAPEPVLTKPSAAVTTH
jgi:hypothetical protein